MGTMGGVRKEGIQDREEGACGGAMGCAEGGYPGATREGGERRARGGGETGGSSSDRPPISPQAWPVRRRRAAAPARTAAARPPAPAAACVCCAAGLGDGGGQCGRGDSRRRARGAETPQATHTGEAGDESGRRAEATHAHAWRFDRVQRSYGCGGQRSYGHGRHGAEGRYLESNGVSR